MVESAAQPIPWQELLLGNAPAPQLTTLPVLLGIRQWNGNPDWRDKYRTMKQMEAMLRQALLENDSMGDCLRLDEGHLLTILSGNTAQSQVAGICQRIMEQCSQALPCEAGCYVGCLAPAAELNRMVDRLLQLEQEQLSSCQVLLLGNETALQPISDSLLTGWRYLLMDEAFDELLTEAEDFFMSSVHSFRSEALHRFHPDFIQLLYDVMSEKHVPAHVLFDRSENARCFREAPDSIANTLTWIFFAVTALSDYLEQRRKSQGYTQKAKEYILSHLSENFTRQALVEQSRLNILLRKSTPAQRYAWFLREYPGLEAHAGKRHIASFLGMTPETLSRVRSSWHTAAPEELLAQDTPEILRLWESEERK